MLLIPQPAHPPIFITTSFIPCSRELARPDSRASSSPRACIAMTGNDLGVTLDTSSYSILCPYSTYPQALSIFRPKPLKYPSPSSSASSILIQTLIVPYSDYLPPSCLLIHPPHTSQENPLKT